MIILDLETTGLDKNNNLIVEIGIVELDVVTRKKEIIFNSPIREDGLETQDLTLLLKHSNLDYEDLQNAHPLEKYRNMLQFIFKTYPIIAYNSNFDFGFLEARSFSLPKKLIDIMFIISSMILQKIRKINI
ncbi:MAG: 3'-5' exonuclease [Promethearchaeota archaeon]